MFGEKIGFADFEVICKINQSNEKISQHLFDKSNAKKSNVNFKNQKNILIQNELQNSIMNKKLQINHKISVDNVTDINIIENIDEKNIEIKDDNFMIPYENTTINLSKNLQGFVFLRGGSVAILTILNQKYLILTKQFRVPYGNYKTGLPAGMLDESGDFCGVAAKELEEETGVVINIKDLAYLTSFYTTPEYSDEEISIFVTHIILKEEEVQNLISKEYGDGNDEIITLNIATFTIEEIMRLNNMTVFAAAFAYERIFKYKIPQK